MSQILINDIFDELKEENNRLLNDLILSQKYIKLLEKYRNCLTSFDNNCKCDRNINNKLVFNLLEKDFNEYQSLQTIECNKKAFNFDSNKRKIRNETAERPTDVSNQNPIRLRPNNAFQLITHQFLDNNIEDKERHELNESNVNYIELSEESDNDMNYDLNEDSVNHKNVMKTKLKKQLLEKINNNEVIEEIDDNNQLIKVFRVKENNSIHSFGCNWNQCQYISRGKSKVNYHIMEMHTKDKVFNCDECNRVFYSIIQLSHHKIYKHKPQTDVLFKCDWNDCKYETKYKNHLNDHMNRHKGIKRHSCHSCDRKFVTSTDLKNHIASHSEIRPHGCDWNGCEYRAKTRTTLMRHKRTHLAVKSFTCDWINCKATFVTKSDLLSHKAIHSTNKMYVCDWSQCNQMFSDKRDLKNHHKSHLIVHQNISPFVSFQFMSPNIH